MPGVAAGQATEAIGHTPQHTELLNRLLRVNRTTGIESACRRQYGGDQSAITHQDENQSGTHRATHALRCGPDCLNARSNSSPALFVEIPAAPVLAMTRKSQDGVRPERQRRKTSRTSRLIRLRVTELPTLPLTVIPNRHWPRSLGSLITTKFTDGCLRPARDSFKNSGRFLRRTDFGNFSLPRGDIPSCLGAGALRRHVHRQSLSPLGAAPLEHFTPAGSLHADEKTVGALSSNIARLIGSLHKINTP